MPVTEAGARTLESPEERRQRIRLGWLLAVLAGIGVLLAVIVPSASLTFDLADEALPDLVLPTKPLAVALAAYMVLIAALHMARGVHASLLTLFVLAFVLTFLCWAVADQTFPLTNQLQGTMGLATPLILGAMAGVLCERAGVINIAIEGQFLAGAFAGAVIGTMSGSSLVGIVGAMLAGLLIAAMLAVFSIRYRVNQVVLGVVLVVFATGITGFLLDSFVSTDSTRFNSPEVLSSVPIPLLADIPVLGPVLFDQTLLVYSMYLIVAALFVVLWHTRWGLRVRAVGEHPRAADTVGIKVLRVRYQAVLIGGLFAGLGGAFYTIGSTGAFQKEMTAGNGFIALAAVIMGRWHPIGAMGAALFFGFTTQLQSQLQIVETPVPSELFGMTPYLAVIIAVAGLAGRVRPPKAEGEPYPPG